jgi:hypothetical protein
MINRQRIPYFFETFFKSGLTSPFISFNEKVMALPMQRHFIFQAGFIQRRAWDVRLRIRLFCKSKSRAFAHFEARGEYPGGQSLNR